ncbi:MAG TPA: methionine--tRNA ligase subunit beta [Candidatus Paceibacterota bacterium]|jgi:methionine--tRNA ligase beta chain|nr:methionine--tRNA ligase subunit beta [Candidatus Paceibacterota bacterium]HPQ22903.1 methionine--tRNA ligase subunit beta [Candidatus Paceibacterota bacterium]
MINFEEFQKIDLKIGKILEAEKVENSEKLLRLKVDLGEEQRQIVAGIGKVYQPQDLINQEIVVVVNLEPKTLMGFESQGMLLAADNNGEPILIKPEKEVLPGTKIH